MADTGASDQAALRAGLLGRPREMAYGGALSFLRRRYTRNSKLVAEADVAVTGIPYDGAVTNRPGARLGPRAIREASTQLAQLKAFPFGFDPFDTLAVIDCGDCFLRPYNPETVLRAIESHISALLKLNVFPLSLGGDHFVVYPILRAMAAHHGPVALLQFDAHPDTFPDDGRYIDHGTMFLRAKNEGLIDVTRSCQVGIRTYNDSDHGFEILTGPWVHRHGVDATIAAIRERVGDAKVYLTFDIDCLDPAYAPGTGTPVAGGLTTAQALELIRGLDGLNLVGADVVEVAPAYDVSEITALAAANIAHDILCLLAINKGAVGSPVGRLR